MTRALEQRGRILKSIAKKERRRLQKLAREARACVWCQPHPGVREPPLTSPHLACAAARVQ